MERKMALLVETNNPVIFIALDDENWARAVCLPLEAKPLERRKRIDLSLIQSWRALDACGDYRRKQAIPVGALYLKNETQGWEETP